MQLVRKIEAITPATRGAVVAIGNFDGLHLGHRAVLDVAQAQAKRLEAPLAVMSFEPHPRRLFHPELPPLRLVPLHQKILLLREAGIDILYLLHFSRAFSQLTAAQFIQKILIEALSAQHVVTGEGFRFGYRRGGTSQQLAAQPDAFGYSPVPAFDLRGMPCSSTRIREGLAVGDTVQVREILGRDYTIHGRVIHGDARGAGLGFATANIPLGVVFRPCFGVYAVTLADASGRCYPAVANLGIRPTYPLKTPQLEVHCLDASPDLYGQRVTVTLKQFLRREQRFDSIGALQTQLAQDVAKAKEILTHVA